MVSGLAKEFISFPCFAFSTIALCPGNMFYEGTWRREDLYSPPPMAWVLLNVIQWGVSSTSSPPQKNLAAGVHKRGDEDFRHPPSQHENFLPLVSAKRGHHVLGL